MELSKVVSVLEELAPLSLAESWDNVGLLVEPSPPHTVSTLMLTNDLTPAVMDEAKSKGVGLIVSYHPPLFRPIKRLRCSSWKERLVVQALERGVAVYSPHTALDCLAGGVNDWLCGGLGAGSVDVLSQAQCSGPTGHRLEFRVERKDELNTILSGLTDIPGVSYQHSTARSADGEVASVSVSCPSSALTPAVQLLSKHSTVYSTLTVLQVTKPPLPDHGQGRLCTLDQPITVALAVQRIKSHLGLAHVRLALGAQCTLESTVRTVAVCAGSGSSVLQGVKADLYLTGEMSHHDVLDAVAMGASVVLCEHSNTERGFLTVLQERLSARLGPAVSVRLSERDADPLTVV
ncbi:NIF3L protein, partial [Amia calva]|nr:NIF3L protein [Amia calva]